MQARNDCGTAKQGLVPITVCSSWSKFDCPNIAQAAGAANSTLINRTPVVALYTAPAEFVQQPYLYRSESQVHCAPPSVQRQLVFAASCSS